MESVTRNAITKNVLGTTETAITNAFQIHANSDSLGMGYAIKNVTAKNVILTEETVMMNTVL
jgi:hypothetical protein